MGEWEAGRRFPTAAEALRACRVAGVDVDRAFAAFPPGIQPDRVGAWLDALRGDRPVVDVARAAGRSRFAVARLLSGKAEPRLPDFLALVEVLTGRVADLVALLVPIERVPALAARRAVLESSRRLAHAQPWSQAVVAALDTAGYRALPAHPEGALAARFGFAPELERACLDDLVAAGVVAREGPRLVLRGPLVVDTAAPPEVLGHTRAHWLTAARDRAARPLPDDVFAYNVFSVSTADLARIRERLSAFYREVRQIVAASEPTDTVALLGVQLVEWP